MQTPVPSLGHLVTIDGQPWRIFLELGGAMILLVGVVPNGALCAALAMSHLFASVLLIYLAQ